MIELLVVIAILAVLAIAVVLVLNPTELIKESRDTTRIEDLGTVNYALSLLQTDQTNAFFGTSTIVYISIPDTTTTCANLGLPTLPSGYTYGCAPTSTYRKADATGWIPVDFFSISYGSPLAKLPIDPINTTSTGLYYTYIPGGSWELTALMESQKRRLGGGKDVASTDGGDTYSIYEVGTNLTRNPVNDSGLVGYWKLDETSGTFADSSGNGNTGTQSGGVTYGQTGKAGKAVGFDGSNDYIRVPDDTSLQLGKNLTVETWVKVNADTGYARMVGKGNSTYRNYGLWLTPNSNILFQIYSSGGYGNCGTTEPVSDGNWHHIAGTYDGSNMKVYVDGVLKKEIPFTQTPYTSDDQLTIGYAEYHGRLNGWLDDIRVYNRALSAAEIQAIYNATR